MKECRIEGCESKVLAKELCNKHYLQVRKHGKTFTSKKEQKNYLLKNFHNNYEIITETGCWIWMKYRDRDGYGVFTKDKKIKKAHRHSYEIHKGDITDGFSVCHKCDIRSCVNPEHLFLGTLADNLQDMVSKGRQCHGHVNGMAKLTESMVKQIKAKIKQGFKLVDIAKEFNVAAGCISKIKLGQRWGYLS